MAGSVLDTKVFGVSDIEWGLLNVEFAVEFLTVVGWRWQAVLMIDEQVRELEARGLPNWGAPTWAGGGSRGGVNYWLVGELRKLREVVLSDFPVGGDVGAVLMEGLRLVNQIEDLELLSPAEGVLRETVKRVVVKACENLKYGRHGVPSSFMVGAEGATATGAGAIRW